MLGLSQEFLVNNITSGKHDHIMWKKLQNVNLVKSTKLIEISNESFCQNIQALVLISTSCCSI